MVSVRDVTKRKKAEEHILRQSAVLDAINKVFRETLMCETDEEVARTCLAVAEELTGSKFGFIGEVNELGRFDTIALSNPGWKACRMPKSDAVRMIKDMEIRGIWGGVLKDGRSLIVNDPASHPDRVGVPEGHPPLTSFLGVPLKREGKTIGIIALANKEGGYNLADQEDIEALSVAFLEALIRKRAEDALRESEEKYRDLYDDAPDMYHSLDKNGIIADCNETEARMLGYKKEEIIGRPITDFFTEESKGLFEKDFPRLNKEKVLLNLEREFVRKDGSTFLASLNVFSVYSKDGKLIGTKTISRDVTERKQVEQQIKGIIDAAPDMIHVISSDMKIINRNSASKKRFPHIKEGEYCYDVLHKRDRVCAHCGVAKVFKDGKKQEHESVIKLPDGKKIIVHSTSAPIFDGEGNVVSAVEILRDITDRKKAEAELKKYARELKEANQLKDLFTDIMRHDLLTPVDIIRNLAEMAADDEKLKDSEDVRMIRGSARKLEEMIMAVSSYAKLESAEGIEWKEMDLNAIIKDAEDVVRPYYEEKHIELEHQPKGKYIARTVFIVEEVFVNLLSNAMKYSPENSKVAVNIEDTGKNWRVTVMDQGVGVPDEHKEKIFDRFIRRNKEMVKGSGIGLAIVKRMADLHGGAAGVLDNPEGGSIFYFEIPKTAKVKT